MRTPSGSPSGCPLAATLTYLMLSLRAALPELVLCTTCARAECGTRVHSAWCRLIYLLYAASVSVMHAYAYAYMRMRVRAAPAQAATAMGPDPVVPQLAWSPWELLAWSMEEV